MTKEEITQVFFSPIPDVRVRVIEFGDSETLIESKKKYPFKLQNSITVCVITDRRTIQFCIHNGFIWNGADIPRVLWRLIGSRTDNDFLLASMVHDYMLNFKYQLLDEVFTDDITVFEYRRLTSLIFREIIKKNGTNTIKANIMSWFVDTFQKFCKWKREKK